MGKYKKLKTLMKKKQKTRRWFLLKHKECGALFTIDNRMFPESFKDQPRACRCPNCGEDIIEFPFLERFMAFLRQYDGEEKRFKDFTIKEMKPMGKEWELPEK